MDNEISFIKKRVNRLQLGLLFCIILILVLLYSAFIRDNSTFNIIRAKGIIVEDNSGRDRILIGAPIPSSNDRIRTDTSLVRKHWAKYLENPNQYMEWYSKYNNSAIGMVVMNEEGFDRVQIGDKLSDPNIGKRMFEPAGIVWNNSKGFELGGAGVNTTKDGKSRSVIGLDDESGEAVHLVALEDGTKGLIIGGEDGRLMIGMSKKDGKWFQNKEAFTGIKFFDTSKNLLWEQQMLKK